MSDQALPRRSKTEPGTGWPPVWSVHLFHPTSCTLLEHDVTRFLGNGLQALADHVTACAELTGTLRLQVLLRGRDVAGLVILNDEQELASLQAYWLDVDEDHSGIDFRHAERRGGEQVAQRLREVIEVSG